MPRTPKNILLFAFVAALTLTAGMAFAADAPVPTPAEKPAPAEKAEAPQAEAPTAEVLVPSTVEMILASSPQDECELQCLQQFRDCRAGGAGGPHWTPGDFDAAYEACVTEWEACLANECGIGC